MAAPYHRVSRPTLHPLHAVLLAGAFPLFLGGLLSDLAYGASYEVQWTNFASWLIAGGLVFSGFALAWAVIDWARSREGRLLLNALLLLAAWVLGFVNALVHAKDAWAAMPSGLVLSIITVVLITPAIWLGLAGNHAGGVK